jgi:hypothetical protein
MGGTLTSLRPDRKPVVLWTPWGAIPRAGFHGRQANAWAKLHNAIEAPQRQPTGKDGSRRPGHSKPS